MRAFAVERLRVALAGGADLIETIELVSHLCIKQGYSCDLFDFYRLRFAYDDLAATGYQMYWDGATRENIVSFMRERAERFTREFDSSA